MTNGSWRVDETYIRVKGEWVYLYPAVDTAGQTIDFLLSAKRDTAAAKRLFRKALGQPHTVNPRAIAETDRIMSREFMSPLFLAAHFPIEI